MNDITPALAHVVLDALAALRERVDSGEVEPWVDYAAATDVPTEDDYRQLLDEAAKPYQALVGTSRPLDEYGVDKHAGQPNG